MFQDPDIKAVITKLKDEVKKDIWFFGACGAFAGWLMILATRLKSAGVSDKSWGDALFGDFVSFNAFGLVFIGLILLGATATVVNRFSPGWQRLDNAVQHVEDRLKQMASSIIAFTIGLSLVAIAHAFFTITGDGLAVTVLTLAFNCVIIGGFTIAVLIAQRTEPFDRWWVALGCMCGALTLLGVIVIKGAA